MKTLHFITLTLFIILVAIFFAACHKDNTPEHSGSVDQVPNSTGDYWKYSIQSSTGENKGFLEVRIIKKGTLTDGRTVTTWIYSYPQLIDTVYKVLNGNSFEEYRIFPKTTEYNYPVMRYIFPLVTGMKWAVNSSLASDSVKVVSDKTVTVPVGTYDHTMQLDLAGSHMIGNYWNNSKYWFTPNIGIIRMEYSVFNLGPDERNGIYELVDFSFKIHTR